MSRGEELRRLMRRVPSGVAVVTVDADGQQAGLTVASLVSLSLEPALVGVAISRQAALHELLRTAGAFAASFLGSGQEAIAAHFARGVPPIALWTGLTTHPGEKSGAPLLGDALGWIECRTAAEHKVGDHTLFVGEVLAIELGPPARPLVYVDQAYATA